MKFCFPYTLVLYFILYFMLSKNRKLDSLLCNGVIGNSVDLQMKTVNLAYRQQIGKWYSLLIDGISFFPRARNCLDFKYN